MLKKLIREVVKKGVKKSTTKKKTTPKLKPRNKQQAETKRKIELREKVEVDKFRNYVKGLDEEDLKNLPIPLTKMGSKFDEIVSSEFYKKLPKSERDSMYKLFNKKFMRLREKRIKKGKPMYRKGGLITNKKYVNPVTIINNLKKK